MIRSHQPGSQPLDIPETIPNPAVPRTVPTLPPRPSEPVKVPAPQRAVRDIPAKSSPLEFRDQYTRAGVRASWVLL